MTFGRRTKSTAAPSVVAEVERQAAEAAALAAISGQERLADPRTNPAVRGLADELRDEQQRQALRAEHARVARRLRVADAQAAEAERALEALALARQASNPARSVLALHTGRRRYMRASLVASVVLAAGSAMGVEAAAHALDAPRGTGLAAEVGLTGLATLAIHYRAHLAEHRGEVHAGSWQSRVLWALMTVPLVISVSANVATLNVLGAACALGAAAFAVLAVVIADRSAAAMQARAAEVSSTDEDELRSAAMGDDLFAPVAEEPQGDSGDEVSAAPDPVAVEAGRGVAEVEAWLADQDGPDGGVAAAAPTPDGSGPQGAALDAPCDREVAESTRPTGHIVSGPERSHRGSAAGHIVADPRADRPERAGSHRAGSRVQAAAKARRAVGDATRSRVAAYLADHPNASNGEIARELRVSEATVKRHRRELRQAAARQSGGER